MNIIKLAYFTVILTLGLIVTACGGGGGDKKPAPVVPPTTSPTVISISGDVSGLSGTVLLKWADREYALTAAGNFAIPAAAKTGDSLTLSLGADPLGQKCTIDSSTAFIAIATDIGNIKISCRQIPLAISGDVSGLSGTVLLKWADREYALTAAGNFAIPAAAKTGDSLTLSLGADPLGQKCTIDSPAVFNSIMTDIGMVKINCRKIAVNITGDIQGLDGELTLQYNGQQQILISSGSFTIANAAFIGENLTLSVVKDPMGLSCVTQGVAEYKPLTTSTVNIKIVCAPQALLNILVTNYLSGAVLADTAVTISWEQDGVVKNTIARTASDGIAVAEINPTISRLAVTGRHAGFSPQTTIQNNPSGLLTLNSKVELLPVTAVQSFNNSEAVNLIVDGLSILNLAPNSVVNSLGEQYNGLVRAEITFIDPSSDPAIMPGNYETKNIVTGKIENIESFGAINIAMFAANGEALLLAPNLKPMLTFPAAQRLSNPPAQIPLFYFDTAGGFWRENGIAQLAKEGDLLVYKAPIDRLAVWNADRVYETLVIKGLVQNAEGTPLTMVKVQSRGQNYLGTATVYTDALGQFQLPAQKNSNILIAAQQGSQSRTLEFVTGQQNASLPAPLVLEKAATTITLSWGKTPDDLDAHFIGPLDSNGEPLFHIYFADDNYTDGVNSIYLDVDDTNSFGPEIISVQKFPKPGVYHFKIHNYSADDDSSLSPAEVGLSALSITRSLARIELNLQGEVKVFTPPSGENSFCWAVFDLTVSADGKVSVEPINTWVESCRN